MKKNIKTAPDALIEMVKEFERQKEEAKKKIDVHIVDPPPMEIDGIVMDETMSKAGRDFYEVFFSSWVKPKDFKNYYIKIKERPFRMNTTLIEVYVSEVLIYQAVLKRRYDDIVDMVKLAKDYTLAYINKLKQDKINLRQSYF
ncbi:CsgE family curli-type amyloid fiber assembly protein [Carboxylicivirga taeanensis]|uniref:CsgE family curli-type amyloid fiber assembly protein n=1 Tax=Carboxylicivirga taeanensis TaxID=1416875 RepID=UPI003F6DD298